jgi:glycosyltransferase involved in cell wall biosynthesis
MKIGIDIRAAIEEPAGIGKIVGNMTKQLISIDAANQYILYSNKPYDTGIQSSRVREVVIDFAGVPAGRLLWHIAVVIRARCLDRVDRFLSVASLQAAVLTKNLVILILPDLTNVLFPEWHVSRSKLTGRWLLRRALRNSREIVAISERTRADILKYAGETIAEGKVSVAHIACENEFFRPVPPDEVNRVRERYGLKSKYILNVGTIEPRKNLPALIKAFAGVAAAVEDLDLIVVGRKGWKWQATFEAAGQSGVGRRIRFLEYVAPVDLPAMYVGAVLFVYPSLYEGFGIPPLEAMACGVPVITSNTSSLPEVVGEAAIQVDPDDTIALQESILKILRDKNLWEMYSQSGRKQSEKFSWQAFGQNILQRVSQRP